ncbi:hypothetical protein EST38_g12506 [Candolleomyces aberdarensis]|uniref:Uncharacterized protein n=1 Tax=Candolleomyces aberdarensis TaxID=2316362 RepID=A0A4Q2D315_9AGAR|nr:hypothetical protein EST38_g12506 [Candolleomyces aberdarensis]
MAVTQAEKITTQLSSHEPKGMQQLLFNAQPSVSPGNDVNTLHDSARYDPPKWDEGIRVEFSEDRGDASRFDDLPVLPTALRLAVERHEKNACMIGIAEPKMMTVNAQPSVSLENDTNTPHDSARYNPPKWDVSTRVRTRHRSEIQGDATQFYEFRDDAIPDSSRLHHSLTHSQPKMVTVNAQPSVSPGNDANALHDSAARYDPPRWGEVEFFSENRRGATQFDDNFPVSSSTPEVPDFFGRRKRLSPISTQSAVEIPPSNLASSLYLPPPVDRRSATSSRVASPVIQPRLSLSDADDFGLGNLHNTSIGIAKPKTMKVNAQPSVSAGNDGVDRPLFSWGMIPAANARRDSDSARYDPPNWDEDTRVKVDSEDRAGVTQPDDFRSDDFLDLSRAPIFHPCDGITELLLKMTGADCALSHDDDWRKRSHEISPWSDDLCFDIITSRTIVARNGVAWLLPRDEDHVEKQELAGNLGTYVPDFHTPPSWSTLDGWGLATPSDLWLMGDYVSPSVGALHPASIAIGATAPLLGGQSSSGLVYDRPLQTGGGGEEGSSDSRAKREREEDDSDKDAPLRKKRDHVEDGTSPRRR